MPPWHASGATPCWRRRKPLAGRGKQSRCRYRTETVVYSAIDHQVVAAGVEEEFQGLPGAGFGYRSRFH